MAELRDTIQGVVLSEKATSDHLMANNTYTFRVGINSNKTEIKQAIQQLFGVRVQAVRTLIMYGDIRRVGRHSGKQSNGQTQETSKLKKHLRENNEKYIGFRFCKVSVSL